MPILSLITYNYLGDMSFEPCIISMLDLLVLSTGYWVLISYHLSLIIYSLLTFR